MRAMLYKGVCIMHCTDTRTWWVKIARKYEGRTDTLPLSRKEIRGMTLDMLKEYTRALYNIYREG